MKRIFNSFIILLCLVLVLSACSSSEKNGVPNSVFERDAADILGNCTHYEASHHVDTDAHTDSVHLTVSKEGQYGKITTNAEYLYQYNKSSDLWTMLGGGILTTEHSLNEDAYVSSSPWIGQEDFHTWGNGNFQYRIDIHQLSSSQIKYSFSIDFEDEDFQDINHTDPITATLSSHGDTLMFTIHLSEAGNNFEDNPLYIYLGIDGISEFCH